MTDAMDEDTGGPGNEITGGPGNEVTGGPGNEAGDGYEEDDIGNRVEGGTARGVLGYLARSLADEPDAVVIETDDSARGTRFRIHVAPGDMGRMIGRRGRVAQAIRTVVRVAGSRDGMDTNVDFVDD